MTRGENVQQRKQSKADSFKKIIKFTGLVRLIKVKERGHKFTIPKMMP